MIIGISGKLQSGKDTTADYLVKKYGFIRIAFADKLKEIAKDLFFWDGEKDDYGRKLLQDIGVAMRKVKEDVWVNYVLQKVNDTRLTTKNWVITDVRFKNEADLVRLSGGDLWRIERKLDRTHEANKHISEVDLDDYKQFGVIINNFGTMNELYEKIDLLLRGEIE